MKTGLTKQEKELLEGVNSKAVKNLSGDENLRLNPSPGNAPFEAQFDINVLAKYFTENGSDVYTSIAASALNSTLKTQLAVFMFGQSDYAAGYKKSMEQFPLSVWTYGKPFTYGRDVAECAFGPLDATVTAQLQKGDIVIPATASPGGTNTLGLIIVRCPQAAMAKLVDSLSSDRFWLNKIRYILTDTSAAGLTQYDNEVKVQMQSLFGLFKENSVSPTAFKIPEQFQAGIVDLPIDQGVDKNIVVGTYINYDSVTQKFSFFVKQFDRVKA